MENNIKEIIPIVKINSELVDNDVNFCKATDLYNFLELDRTHYNRWIMTNILKNRFALYNEDYINAQPIVSLNGGRPKQDYYLNINFAKKIAMLTNSKKGEEIRNYFIDCEKRLKQTIERIQNIQSEDWKEIRSDSKKNRTNFTDTIKEYIEYCKNNGSKNADMYYVHFTRALNNKLFGLKEKKGINIRDYMTTIQLSYVITIEECMRKEIEEGLSKNVEYHELYKMATSWIDKIVERIGLQTIEFEGRKLLSSIED